ncbi:endonuclease/exonuclease/phosphatase family protein [Poseidonocella sedimentorum]|uniref:Endonuclease/Exonuclease/phosphatase family protein n=1 Tax=Poseidonocella sedimentorum TaxID=871652 RepID=A0A1I6CT31_9RHOB|nr:endonuclease/exonuclease/phosphatase family protein [Poseidonocella sedimentorum]SFQ96346.1 Endonuclease/Exonuclease/phosphatase family protein [Poseidonocella sedimentorum]
MRIATYNVEWFTDLFDTTGALLNDRELGGRRGVTRADQIAALVTVFRALDADAILVVEAPDEDRRRSTVRALETFAGYAGLRARRAIIGYANHTKQELALLYDPDRLSAVHDPVTLGAPGFDASFEADILPGFDERAVRFSKPPLELALETAGGQLLRLIGVHLKSKAPHGARSDREILELAVSNRLKQLTQATWLRARIAAHLAAGEALIVAGDLNDGPGLDEFETLFGKSSVEIVLGAGTEHPLIEPNAQAALSQPQGARASTARFYIARKQAYLQALLDYVMLSPDLAARDARWRIWHPYEDETCWTTPDLRAALLLASDHFPVSVDLAIA